MRPVPRVPPFDREATYDDLKKVPDIQVAEIVDGELHATPRPAFPHAKTGAALGMVIGPPYQFGRGGPGGWWILDEPELHFAKDVVVPDLAGWRRTRMPSVPTAPWITLAPDWVCEVLSPSTAAFDRRKKLGIYAREGVSHMWLIDPLERTLEVLRLENGRWTILGVHGGNETVSVEPFTETELRLGDLWTDAGVESGSA